MPAANSAGRPSSASGKLEAAEGRLGKQFQAARSDKSARGRPELSSGPNGRDDEPADRHLLNADDNSASMEPSAGPGRRSGSGMRQTGGGLAIISSGGKKSAPMERSPTLASSSGLNGEGGRLASRANATGGSGRAYLASDNERHKRKLAKARERRATLILGLIMAAFICSWLPFFTFYVIRALCYVCRDYISPRFEAFIFWMGYCNSAINPIIYTIFNRDFRKAFRKILFKCL